MVMEIVVCIIIENKLLMMKFIVRWGDKVDSGIGLSYRPARLHWLAGRCCLCRSQLYPEVVIDTCKYIECSTSISYQSPSPPPPRCMYPKCMCMGICGQRGRKRFIASWGQDVTYLSLHPMPPPPPG